MASAAHERVVALQDLAEEHPEALVAQCDAEAPPCDALLDQADASTACRPKRADALRNRAAILEAAETVFAAQGISAPIDEVAREACVGVGTVYRHFPTKEALFEAILTSRVEQFTQEVAASSASRNPGEALFELMGRVVEVGSRKKDLADALASAGIDIKERSSHVFENLLREVDKLLRRAQEAGDVRSDITVEDLMGLVSGACVTRDSHIDDAGSKRMLEVICDGLRVRNQTDA
ncbi:MAG TPA: helix-turn-helix domain-containing protein [Acidimicrobiales bacterium]|nr:helix-turn-helix domain-containing protein [Acidimicrobiales bacterium]